MAEESLRHKTFTSVLWRVAEVGGNQVVQFGISMVLARLILPEQFGAIAMIMVFTSFMATFIDCGFCTALMRKENRTQLECSTVFYFNLTLATICYGILFLISPLVADFYEMPELCWLLRVVSLSLIIKAFSAVQGTLFSAQMNFKLLAKYNVLATVISGALGIWFAYLGYQVWALVIQQLSGAALTVIFLWWKSTWRPALVFSFKVVKEYFAFGSKLLASSLLDNVFSNLYTFVIGKLYKATELAFYNRAGTFTSITSVTPTGVLRSVTFPALCKVQNDDERLREGYRSMLRLSAFIIFPLCVGCGAVSYPLVNILFSETWIDAAPLLQITVFSAMWYPIHSINLNLLLVKGHSELFLRLEIIKKVILIGVLAATAPFGLIVMCYGSILSSILCLIINTHYTGKLLNLGLKVQLMDLWPSLLLTIVMYVACKFLSTILGYGVVSLVSSIALGIAIYVGGAFLFRFKELSIIRSLKNS